MSKPVEKEKVKPWHWPGQWVKDQSFYRDIATRTASGVAVVAITYLFAVFMGYIQNPGVWNGIWAFIGSVSVTSLFGAIAGFLVALISFAFHRITRNSNRQLKEASAELEEELENQRKDEEPGSVKG